MTSPPKISVRKLRKDPLRVLADLKRTQGDVARARFGASTFFLVSHPADIKRVLVENSANYVRTLMRYERRLRPEDLPSPGDTIGAELDLEARRIVHPAFSRARVDAQWPAFFELAQERVSAWPVDETIDVLEAVRKIVVELAMRAVFERELDVPIEELAPRARLCMEAIETAVSGRSAAAERLRFRWLARVSEAYETIHDAVSRALDERRSRNGRSGDALSLLLNAAERKGWSDGDIAMRGCSLVLTFSDSTGPATAWALYELARDAQARTHVRREADELAQAPEQGIRNAGYLRAVLHENLRLHPPLWRLARRACTHDRLGEYTVRPGDFVWVSPYLIHRDERFWPHPDSFLPERWLEETPPERPKLAYLPFGAGSRMCMGDFVAWYAMAATILAVAQRFDFTLPPSITAIESDPARPVRRPLGGVRLDLHPRAHLPSELRERRTHDAQDQAHVSCA